MNKVISFCLYGHQNMYCKGLIENIDIINNKFRDWKIYVYYNGIPDHILDILRHKENTYLFECNHNGYKWEGMFWRFYPIENDSIDYFLSRDADSRISEREMGLVNEWINSGKSFHIIRDNPQHGIEILGGTFGVDVKKFKNLSIHHNFKNINFYLNKYYRIFEKNVEKWPDQHFLKEIIYPIIKNNNLTHISYENVRFSINDKMISPNPSDFVGLPVWID